MTSADQKSDSSRESSSSTRSQQRAGSNGSSVPSFIMLIVLAAVGGYIIRAKMARQHTNDMESISSSSEEVSDTTSPDKSSEKKKSSSLPPPPPPPPPPAVAWQTDYKKGDIVHSKARAHEPDKHTWGKIEKDNGDGTFLVKFFDKTEKKAKLRHADELDDLVVDPTTREKSIERLKAAKKPEQCPLAPTETGYIDRNAVIAFTYFLKENGWEKCTNKRLYLINIEYTGKVFKAIPDIIKEVPGLLWVTSEKSLSDLLGKVSTELEQENFEYTVDATYLTVKVKKSKGWEEVFDGDLSKDATYENLFKQISKLGPINIQLSYHKSMFDTVHEQVMHVWSKAQMPLTAWPIYLNTVSRLGFDPTFNIPERGMNLYRKIRGLPPVETNVPQVPAPGVNSVAAPNIGAGDGPIPDIGDDAVDVPIGDDAVDGPIYATGDKYDLGAEYDFETDEKEGDTVEAASDDNGSFAFWIFAMLSAALALALYSRHSHWFDFRRARSGAHAIGDVEMPHDPRFT